MKWHSQRPGATASFQNAMWSKTAGTQSTGRRGRRERSHGDQDFTSHGRPAKKLGLRLEGKRDPQIYFKQERTLVDHVFQNE